MLQLLTMLYELQISDCMMQLASTQSILYLIPITTVTSQSAAKDTHCKTHILYVKPGVPFGTLEKPQVARMITSVFVWNTR